MVNSYPVWYVIMELIEAMNKTNNNQIVSKALLGIKPMHSNLEVIYDNLTLF